MNQENLSQLYTKEQQAQVAQDLHLSMQAKQRFGTIYVTRDNSTKELQYFAEDNMQIYEDHNFVSSEIPAFHFVNSNAIQCRWKVDAQGNLPDFTNCTQDECHFTKLPADAVIHFYGMTKLLGCQFYETQTVVIHDDAYIENCTTVKLAVSNENRETEGTGHKIQVTGGRVILPHSTEAVYGAATIDITGAEVVSDTDDSVIYSLTNITGCKVKTIKGLAVRKLVGSTITYTTSETAISLGYDGFGIVSDNEIDADVTNKAEITFAAGVVTGNWVNTANTADGKIQPTSMKYSSVQYHSGNMNGAVVS